MKEFPFNALSLLRKIKDKVVSEDGDLRLIRRDRARVATQVMH